MKLSDDAQAIILKSRDKEKLTAVMKAVEEKMDAAQITPTELQWTVLINHLNEMVERAERGEKMSGVDPELFSEVSPEALGIAREVVNEIGNLTEDESYVLSIHFETAKMN